MLENLDKRILASLIMVPLALIIVFAGGFIFNLAMLAIALMLFYEAITLLNDTKKTDLLEKYLLHLVLYISIPISSMVAVRYLDNGVTIILFSLILVWITDICAYYGGKSFGGPKLIEKVSPNKTISGSLSGLAAVGAFSIIAYFFTNKEISIFGFMAIAIFLSIIAQIGDLFESWLKRKLGVKDSGTIIPGHGGLFDRLDSILFVMPISYLIFGLVNNNIF